MKICLASIHPRMLSGQIEALVALSEALSARGHQVRVVSAFTDEQLQAERRWAVETSDAAHLARKVLRMAGTFGQLLAVGRQCDVVHFSVPTPSFAVLGDAVQALTRKPTVVGFEAHLAHVPSAIARLRAAPEFYLPRILINNGLVARTTLHRAANYVVSSQYQKRELAALGYDALKVEVIPNFVDRKKLAPVAKGGARRDLGLPDLPLVVFAGHYHDVKGHDLLIEAFRRSRGRVPSARLVLAWSGIGNQARVQSQIADAGLADAVVEIGRVSIGTLFSAADVVALPYRMTIGQAAYPGTVLEAMAVGVPLVTTAHPLLVELIKDGETGLLARPGDTQHLAAQIVTLLDDASLRSEMVAAQRAEMGGRFSIDALTTAYEAVYERALAGKTRLLQTA